MQNAPIAVISDLIQLPVNNCLSTSTILTFSGLHTMNVVQLNKMPRVKALCANDTSAAKILQEFCRGWHGGHHCHNWNCHECANDVESKTDAINLFECAAVQQIFEL